MSGSPRRPRGTSTQMSTRHATSVRHKRRYRISFMRRPLFLLFLCLLPLGGQAPRKRVLAWADTLTGYQHDSISHAVATMERLGRESGAYEMYIRTDSQLIT